MNIELLQKMVKDGYINKTDHPSLPLSIYKYSKSCVYEKVWNEATLNCRGIVLDNNYNVIAQPFNKFFNYGEINCNIPDEPFTVTEKLDGSLGIVFYYNGQWFVNTSGSFNSEQSLWAKKWFDENVISERMEKSYTYLFEIIYPENRIVVDYGNKSEMVLLGIIVTINAKEMSYNYLKHMSGVLNVNLTKMYEFNSFSDIVSMKDKLSSNEEGYVVTFKSGYKVKIKGEKYCEIHRTISNMTPLNFWENYDCEKRCVSNEFIESIPEEFRKLSDKYKKEIEKSFDFCYNMIDEIYNVTPVLQNRKEIYQWLNINYPQYACLVMYKIDGKEDKINYHVKKICRPKNNIVKEVK